MGGGGGGGGSQIFFKKKGFASEETGLGDRSRRDKKKEAAQKKSGEGRRARAIESCPPLADFIRRRAAYAPALTAALCKAKKNRRMPAADAEGLDRIGGVGRRKGRG